MRFIVQRTRVFKRLEYRIVGWKIEGRVNEGLELGMQQKGARSHHAVTYSESLMHRQVDFLRTSEVIRRYAQKALFFVQHPKIHAQANRFSTYK